MMKDKYGECYRLSCLRLFLHMIYDTTFLKECRRGTSQFKSMEDIKFNAEMRYDSFLNACLLLI